jgi:hypothetical protein
MLMLVRKFYITYDHLNKNNIVVLIQFLVHLQKKLAK